VPGDYVVVNEVFGSNIDRYSVTSTWYTGTNQYAEMDIARADFSFDMDAAGVKKVDLGVRYGVREVEQVDYSGEGIFTNGYGDPFIAQWKDSGTSAPLTGESYIPPISFNDSRLQGKTVQISDFQGTQGLGNLWFIDPEALYNPREFHELLYGTQAEVPIPERTFELEETTSTFYVQADFEDLFGWNLNGNIGVRVVQTEFDITQNEATNEEVITINGVDYLRGPGAPFPMGTPVTVKRDYTDTLPALNLSYDLTDNQKLRFAYNSAVTTHDALNLAGGLSINRIIACNIQTSAGEDVFCAVGGNALGNPDLEPWRSDNYDLSYEWYFSDSGLLSVGYFYIDIESFIFTSVVYRDDIPDSDGVIRGYDAQSQQLTGLVPISASVNSEEGASIQGLEIGYRQAFDFLDGWVNGFGLDANFTYSPSDSGLFDYYGEENTLMDNSEKQFNLAIWYDKYSWEARLAGNYRSKTYLYNTAQGDYVFAKFRKPTTYVDASIAYHLGDAWTFSLLATNITEESLEDYYQWEDLFANHFINERRITLGAQFRM
jgi:TonB-dependent receptor